jgi:hypothetical protein
MLQPTSCQNASIKVNASDCYSYLVGEHKVSVCEVEILNQSHEDFVLWFEKESIENFDEKRKIHSYFFKVKGDFNFFSLLADRNAKNTPPILYETFMKKIGINESFRLKIIGKEITLNKTKAFIAEHLVSINLAVLKTQLKQPDSFFPWFTGKSIDLLESDLP